MASLAYLKLSGVKGPSVIKGPPSAGAESRLNHIPVIAVTHDVGSTIDGEGVSGERKHHPIFVTKNIDFTTPALHKALTTGEAFENGWINFFHMPRSGDESNYYSIVMTGLQVVSIKSVMPSTQDPLTTDIHEYEEVGFIYKGISWLSHSPVAGTLEAGSFKHQNTEEAEAKFEKDWLEEEAEANAKDILNKVKEEVKRVLKEEAKKKLDESKKK